MTIIITNPRYWYSRMKGRKFEVTQSDNPNEYTLIANPELSIWKGDCEVVEDRVAELEDATL